MAQSGTDKYNRLLYLRKYAESQLNSLRQSAYTVEKIQSPFKRLSPDTNSSGDQKFDIAIDKLLGVKKDKK